MPVVGRLDRYASMLAYEFDETTANNTSINTTGTYYASEFDENIVGIVTDGLVLNLDAGNPSSYPGTGTTWTDLSGRGNNGTLINSPSYSSANGGSIVFNGTNNAVRIPVSASLQSANFTFDIWVKYNVSNVNQMFFSSHYESFGTPSGIRTGMTDEVGITGGLRAFYYSTYLNNTIESSSGGIYIHTDYTNIWVNIVGTWDGTNKKRYFNGNYFAVQNVPGQVHSQLNDFYLGNNADQIANNNYTNSVLNGNIAAFKFYNRALTDSEIRQNFNSLAGRFNLSVPLIANVSTPYDIVYDDFGAPLFGAGQGRYMRHYTDKSVIVYNEIDEVTPIETTIPTNGLQLYIDPAKSSRTLIPEINQAAYTTPGSYAFTVPDGITVISAVVVGGGGGGGGADTGAQRDETNGGGGGGGLAYGNITVTPGEVLTVTVGSGGNGGVESTGGTGGTTTISRAGTVLLSGGGGSGGQSGGGGGAGGASGGTARIGGGSGGSGGGFDGNNSGASGGGGAGGYSGNGGNGGAYNANGVAGQGGGGGGGAGYNDVSNTLRAGGGGGVGILGSGVGGNGTAGLTNGGGGGGGSNGTAGGGNTTGLGGQYGGGGGGKADGTGTNTPGGNGTGGAARIIWGPNRSYPSTGVADQSVPASITLSDLSGNGRTATGVNGATYVSNQNQGIITYDGVDDYFVVTGYKGVTGTGARTSIIWYKSNVVDDFCRIFGWGQAPTAGNKWVFNPDGSDFHLSLGTAGSNKVGGPTTPNITDGSWHMLAASAPANGTVNDIKLYVDGDLLTDTTVTSPTTAINTAVGADVSFGASLADLTPENIIGSTSQVLIYNRQLDDIEIRQIYRSTLYRF